MPKSIGASAANPQTAAAQFAPTAPKPAAMPTPGSNTQNDIRSPKLNAPAGGSGLATLSQTSTSTAQPATPTLATAPAPATAQSAQPQPPQVNDPAQQARMAERAAKQQAFDANMQAIGGRVAALDKRIAESSMTGQELAKSRGVDLSAEYNPHSGTTYAKSNPTQQELLVHDRLRQGLSAEGAKAQYDKGVAATQAARAAGTDELRKRVQPWQPTAEQMSGVPEDELVSLSKGTVLRPGSYEEFVRNEPGLQKAIEALPPEQSQNGMALASEYAKRRLGQLQAAKSYFAHPNTWHESRDWTKPGLKEYAQEHGLRPDQYADALYRNQGEVEASQSDPQLSIMDRGLDNITRWTLPTPKPAEGATEQSSLLSELAAQTRAQGTGSNPFSAIRQTAGELNPDHRLSGPVADAVKTRTQMENLEGGREGMPLDPATWNPLRPLRDAVVKHVTGRDSRMPTDASLKPGYWETAGNNLPSIPAVPGQDFSQAGQTIGDVADLAGRGVADVGRMAGGGLGGAATMIPATAASLGHVGKNFFKEVYDSATGAPRTSVADQTAGFARRLTNRIQDDPSIKYWQAMPDRYWEAANAGYRDLKGLMPPESGTPEAEAAHRAHMAAFDKLISEGHSVNDAANLLRAKGLQQLKANNPVAEDDAKSIELAGKVSPQAARTTKQLLNAGDYAAKAIPLVATGNWAAARGLPLAGAFSSMSNFNSGAGAAQRAAAPVVGAALDQMPGVRNTLANSDAAAAVGAGAGLYPFGRMGLDLINKVPRSNLSPHFAVPMAIGGILDEAKQRQQLADREAGMVKQNAEFMTWFRKVAAAPAPGAPVPPTAPPLPGGAPPAGTAGAPGPFKPQQAMPTPSPQTPQINTGTTNPQAYAGSLVPTTSTGQVKGTLPPAGTSPLAPPAAAPAPTPPSGAGAAQQPPVPPVTPPTPTQPRQPATPPATRPTATSAYGDIVKPVKDLATGVQGIADKAKANYATQVAKPQSELRNKLFTEEQNLTGNPKLAAAQLAKDPQLMQTYETSLRADADEFAAKAHLMTSEEQARGMALNVRRAGILSEAQGLNPVEALKRIHGGETAPQDVAAAAQNYAKTNPQAAEAPGFFDRFATAFQGMDGTQQAMLVLGLPVALAGIVSALSGDSPVMGLLMALIGGGAAFHGAQSGGLLDALTGKQPAGGQPASQPMAAGGAANPAFDKLLVGPPEAIKALPVPQQGKLLSYVATMDPAASLKHLQTMKATDPATFAQLANLPGWQMGVAAHKFGMDYNVLKELVARAKQVP